MAHLIIEQRDLPTMTVPLQGRDMRLGRANDNDIVLSADEVSRQHAQLSVRDGGFVLTDLNSLNGTYVNRQRVRERRLAHRDEIWLGGRCRLVFEDPTGTGAQAKTPPRDDDALRESLERIREEMDRVGASLNRIGKARKTPEVGGEAAASHAYRRLAALYQASKLIASDFDLEKRLAAVLDTALDLMGADRGFLMLAEEPTGQLEVRVAREMGRDLQASSPSMSIAGKAAAEGAPVLVRDAPADREFGGRDSVVQERIVSAMAVPLRVKDRLLGVIYIDSRKPGHAFGEQDLELFSALAVPLSMAIENVRLYEQSVTHEKTRASLGRFLSPAIVDKVLQSGGPLQLGGEKRTVTTLFCDVRGFTAIAEQLEPAVLVDMLNEHFTAMTKIIFREVGTLDKYIGDEIMAVFGAPLQNEDDPLRAVRSALAMQARNKELNAQRSAMGRPVFELGVGIATGEVIAGYVGAPERMEFTVVGDRVNTARRLCSLATAGQVVADADTYALVKETVDAKAIGTCILRGKERTIHAYEIIRLHALASDGGAESSALG